MVLRGSRGWSSDERNTARGAGEVEPRRRRGAGPREAAQQPQGPKSQQARPKGQAGRQTGRPTDEPLLASLQHHGRLLALDRIGARTHAPRTRTRRRPGASASAAWLEVPSQQLVRLPSGPTRSMAAALPSASVRLAVVNASAFDPSVEVCPLAGRRPCGEPNADAPAVYDQELEAALALLQPESAERIRRFRRRSDALRASWQGPRTVSKERTDILCWPALLQAVWSGA
jgi:hypothetical protein